MLFSIVQIGYWLALATWFGGIVFAVMAPPIILRTVRESNPMLPHVLSVNLEGQHAVLLSQSIIGQLMIPLRWIELVCAAVLLLMLIAQWAIIRPVGLEVILPLVRTALFFAATGLLVYDWRFIWPRVWKHRQEYLDHADEPEIANPALDQFDRAQSMNWMILQVMLGVLLAMILFSANIHSSATTITFSAR